MAGASYHGAISTDEIDRSGAWACWHKTFADGLLSLVGTERDR